jgi:RNA polymerase sigma factor (sigma-70 family)
LQYLSSNETEDAIQNLFLYILQHRKSISKVKNVKAYLFISYRNQIIKLRKVKNLSYVQVDIESIVGEQISYTKEKMIGELLMFIKKLSPREKEIIKLKYFQDYKNAEIANSLNIEYQTVRNILHNAIKKLRKLDYKLGCEL